MTWDAFALEWLARAAAGGFVVLAAAAAAVRWCAQPADRVRITGLALAAAVLVPWVALVPGRPSVPVAVLQPEPAPPVASDVPEPTTAPAVATPTVVVRPSVERAALAEPPSESGSLVEPVSVAAASAPAPAVGPEPTPVAAAVASPPQSGWWTAGRAVLALYAAVTAGFALWTAFGLWRLFLLRRSARPAPPEAVALLREIAGPAADRVRLLVSARVDAPVAFAGLRPAIVLPASGNSDALAYGLAHEWSHVERGDVWRWWLVALAQVVLFYQPLFWWLRRHLRLSQDYLADARAAGHADPIDYAGFLVALARRRLSAPALALGMTDRRSNLTRRVHMLLLNRAPLSRRCRAAWTCGALLVAAALVAGVSAVRLTAAPLSSGLTAASSAEASGAATDGRALDDKRDEKKPAEDKKPAGPAKAETLRYSGTVTDKDTKKPIAGAVVTVRRSVLGDPERAEQNPVLEETRHTTDAAGKYAFAIPPEQTAQRYLYIELDVEHPEYAAQKGFGYALSMIRKNEKLGGRPFFESVELRPGKPVTGELKTPDGKPAAGVKVMAYSVTNRRSGGEFEYGSFADTRTDKDGKFRLPLTTPGWAVVWLLPEDFVPETYVVKDKRGELGTFTLKPGPRLKGVLLDAKGRAVAGAIVNADSQERNDEITEPVADQINRSAVTNDKGEWEMRPLPPGKYLVKPGDHQHDASLDRGKARGTEPPGVYVGTKVTLKAGAAAEPVEVRAVPHVTIEARHVDSAGKPTRGHAPFVFGEIDGTPWFGQAKAAPDGTVTAHVPHGLTNVQLDLMTNEHGALRWRKKKGDELNNGRRVQLGTVTDDVKGIEIVRYTAPILVVKLKAADGAKVENTAVTADYAAAKGRMDGKFIVGGGRHSDVTFERQEDGRFRSSQLFPDEEVTVTGHADGYVSKPEKVKLAEGTTKEIELVLEKGEKKPEKKEK